MLLLLRIILCSIKFLALVERIFHEDDRVSRISERAHTQSKEKQIKENWTQHSYGVAFHMDLHVPDIPDTHTHTYSHIPIYFNCKAENNRCFAIGPQIYGARQGRTAKTVQRNIFFP